MTVKNRVTDACVLLSILILASCRAPSIGPASESDDNFEKVQIGESRKRVEALWGAPDIGEEKYQARVFSVLQYRGGRVIFTIDPSEDQVVSRSRYIDSSDKTYDLAELKRRYFPNVVWKDYVPCHSRSNQDKILVNRERGLYVATSGENAAFVSWSTPEMVDFRVKLLYQHCAKRQPPND